MDVVLKAALAQISAPRGAGLSASHGGGEAGRSGFVSAEVRLTLDEGSPPRVLLVEDNPVNQVVALEFLNMMGVVAVLAADGQEALDACARQVPDLVLMDIQMPGMDGLECARRLRVMQREGQLASFPILALTAHALDADVCASLEAGMDEHLTKPLDFASLRKHLQRWLNLPSSQ
jgi:CheY-like chemotaxis protein